MRTRLEDHLFCADEEYFALPLTRLIIADVCPPLVRQLPEQQQQAANEDSAETQRIRAEEGSDWRKSGDGVRKMELRDRQFS